MHRDLNEMMRNFSQRFELIAFSHGIPICLAVDYGRYTIAP